MHGMVYRISTSRDIVAKDISVSRCLFPGVSDARRCVPQPGEVDEQPRSREPPQDPHGGRTSVARTEDSAQ